MKTLTTEIVIDVAPQTVWSILDGDGRQVHPWQKLRIVSNFIGCEIARLAGDGCPNAEEFETPKTSAPTAAAMTSAGNPSARSALRSCANDSTRDIYHRRHMALGAFS
jgi:hypothetical protein